MAVISPLSAIILFVFYLPTLIGAWKEREALALRRHALKNGEKTLATQGDSEISGIMWADVGGGGGFGGI
jgi:hypothetical protein